MPIAHARYLTLVAAETYPLRMICLITAIVWSTWLPVSLAQEPMQMRVIVASGDAAPGAGKRVTFARMSIVEHSLNNLGEAVFIAKLTGPDVDESNHVGIWAGRPGEFLAVARSGERAPGTPARVVFKDFERVWINDFGDIHFTGITTGDRDDALGIWVGSPDDLTLVARVGDPAPGMNKAFTRMHVGTFNHSSQLVFGAMVGSVSGIWSGDPDKLSLVVRQHGRVPGMADRTRIANVNIPVITDSGQIMFAATLYGGKWQQGILGGPPGKLSAIVGAGEQASQIGNGVHFGTVGDFRMAPSGQLAFGSLLTGNVELINDSALWTGNAEKLSLLAREGDVAPGTAPGVRFDQLWEDIFVYNRETISTLPSVNRKGMAAFEARIKGAGVDASNNTGIWTGQPGALNLIVRTGEHPPGTPAGVKFKVLYGPTLNDAGQLAFVADLSGPGVTAANQRGLWIYDPDHGLLKIARSGDHIETRAGERKVIAKLPIITAWPTVVVTDLGQTLVQAEFTDGSSAILLGQISSNQ